MRFIEARSMGAWSAAAAMFVLACVLVFVVDSRAKKAKANG